MYDIQKASVLKRLSAFLFDFIFIAIISVGIAFAISGITNFYGTLDSYQAHIDNYAEEHGIKLDITEEEYNALSEDERKLYDGMGMELFNNEDFVRDYELIISLTLVMVTLSPFVAFLMLEFLVPLFLKNGQTLGKKIFAIGVVRMDSVRLTPLVLFARNILGKFTIGTMIPLYMAVFIFMQAIFGISFMSPLVCIVVFAGIVLLNVGLFILTRTRSCIHDCFSSTVVVDMATQMVFESAEERLEYKKRIHLEAAEKAKY